MLYDMRQNNSMHVDFIKLIPMNRLIVDISIDENNNVYYNGRYEHDTKTTVFEYFSWP